MKFHSKTCAGLTVLMLGLTAITVLPAQAQNRDYNGNYNRGPYQAPAPPRVEFQGQTRWINIPGTNVMMISAQQRPAYDLFKLGSTFYIYNSGYWYNSNSWNGNYTAIDQRSVPADFMNVPRAYWNDYTWASQTGNGNNNYSNNGNNNYYNRGPNQAPMPPQVVFQSQPRWIGVPGTNVMVTSSQQRPAYDLFKLGSTFYIYNSGYWYSSNRWDGNFTAIDQRSVPTDFMNVPRAYWNDYTWASQTGNGDNNYSNNGNDNYYNRGPNQAPMSPSADFRRQPRWMRVQGTNVMMTSAQQRPAYDLFKLGSTFYIYDNGYWYSSNRWNGTFTAINQRSVPADFMNVPRAYWRNYPEAWATRTDNGNHYGQYRHNHGGYRNP